MYYVLHSKLLHGFLRAFVAFFYPQPLPTGVRSSPAYIDYWFGQSGEKIDGSVTVKLEEYEGLKFLLSFCFAVSALSQFFSLLAQDGDQGTCGKGWINRTYPCLFVFLIGRYSSCGCVWRYFF